MTCYTCGKLGHISKNCYTKNKVYRGTINNIQKDVTCYIYGKQGHYSKECPNKERRQFNSMEIVTAEKKVKEPAYSKMS
jgi:hypothetical protein